jgi:hypothetical protein
MSRNLHRDIMNPSRADLKKLAKPSPPRLPQAEAMAAYCRECFVNPGEPCQNYKGQAKPPCRSRGQVTAPKAATIVEPDLFAVLADEAEHTCDNADAPPYCRACVDGVPLPEGFTQAPVRAGWTSDAPPAQAEEPIEPAPGNRWTLHQPQATPSQAAERFSLDIFGRSRPLLGGAVSGRWNGQRFEGYFHFEDGNACYLIECTNAVYSIRRE